MKWFWYFLIYSFLGFLLELAFSRLAHTHPDRKCLLVLPLCPVYGLGACASMLLAPLTEGNPAALFLLGMAVCTAAEYAMAVWYECGIGVRFWDYTGLAGNLHGRVCLPFSAVWGLLILGMAYWVHPVVALFVSAIPPTVTAVAIPIVLADIAVSSVMLRRTGDRACLRWRNAFFPGESLKRLPACYRIMAIKKL